MVSVAMPAYNEADGIADAVRGYLALPEVDEVVVADNNSTDGTSELASASGARVVRESRQGYGYACQASLREAAGDLIVLVEPDSTFRQTDIHKFFAYAEEFDAVFGTRTSKTCIWEGSNMGPSSATAIGRSASCLSTCTMGLASPMWDVLTSCFGATRCARSSPC